ncbi:hypothetical protein AJ79_06081 [Helicocarpus griseus UAMH5409]|uniref:C2H2-type domain-containing protein n=1 Tax=Helicocarpus griseus UAMH5409 TaxID=1447875 RepID=A0A2B7XH27_9EURO|nr:hypothetical protein AJ79_06081 [Helicocarpus griseus UAMH5409]
MGRRNRVQKHIDDDDSERIHVCSICNRAFKRTEHRQRHERAHTKVKPYNCRFCERSYGRKDLVVRHEKTLHEEDWNNAKKRIEKQFAESKEHLRPRKRRRVSTISSDVKRETSIAPSQIYQYQGSDELSVYPAITTTPLPISPEESDFDCSLFVFSRHRSFPYLPTPRTRESIEYPDELFVPDTSIPGVPQTPNQCYAEGLHQLNYETPEKAAETHKEPHALPVDPNLLESTCTRT